MTIPGEGKPRRGPFFAATVAPGCTPPPPVPSQGSTDWGAAVHPNCFDNLARVGLWVGGTLPLRSGQSPSRFFQPMSPDAQVGTTEGSDAAEGPFHVYVLAHGWAPGFRAAVNAQGGRLRWWDDAAHNSDGIWTSDWAWTPVSGYDPALPVNSTGLLQSIKAFDPKAWVFAYSWIDDSATDGSYLDLGEVYQSEAYTQVNGIRLANALLRLLVPQFWTDPANTLHLIGHSHGSKVVTMAALTLQDLGLPVAHLTLLDSPESKGALIGNGANFLGFFLEQMRIADPTSPSSSATFVDNYPSYFGVAYGGSPKLANVVDVALDPSKIYDEADPGDKHSYAAAWYGAAAAAAQTFKLPSLGFSWPPPKQAFLPALLQRWVGGTTQSHQWPLQTGTPPYLFLYSAPGLPIDTLATLGNVSGTPASGLVFGAPKNPQIYSMFQGGYMNDIESHGYGLAFDVTWDGAQDGDYLVITGESGEERIQEVVVVLDGKTRFRGTYPLTLAADASNVPFFDLWFFIFYFPAPGNQAGQVTVGNFRRMVVIT
ncbi:MAG TPA: hypothetical protein VN851_19680 [Thermoanaerobaculia bacterium]|nr:hypothetical protein [Thermoanaerobaculia bacterium]